MAVTIPDFRDDRTPDYPHEGANAEFRRALSSAVSWGAILAGAAAAASLSLILLILGTGLGLSSVSPWYHEGISAATFSTSTIVWLTVAQLLAAGMGGYLAGRLRTKWVEVHTDEVYFRDTAHGFLAWSVASLVTAGLLTSVIGSILSGGMHASATVAGGAAHAATVMPTQDVRDGGRRGGADRGPMAYFVESLFRREAAATADTGPDAMVAAARNENRSNRDLGEVTRIFLQAGNGESLPSEDLRYVGQVVAHHTGLSQQDAERRVADVYARLQAKWQDTEAATRRIADEARKASAYGALWLFISLLVGAFVASLSATIGGRRRDA